MAERPITPMTMTIEPDSFYPWVDGPDEDWQVRYYDGQRLYGSHARYTSLDGVNAAIRTFRAGDLAAVLAVHFSLVEATP